VVRIVADQTTSGIFLFDNVNKPGGSIEVNITPEMADSLTVSISGASATKPENQSMSLSASIAETGVNATYVWYVNGNSEAAGETFVFDDTWKEGYYRIDVTAFSADGKRAGSATANVEVTEPQALAGFVTTWKTDNADASNDDQITLPLVSNGSYDFTVYWGDGASGTIT